MKSSLFTFLVVVCLLVSVVGCKSTATATPTTSAATVTGTIYKIGVAVSVTGSASTLGEPERDVAAMLQQQLNAKGGIIGSDGVLHPVELIIEDTQGSGDVAVTLVKKLIDDEGVVAIIGPSTSTESMALIPIVQESQVTLISLASSSSIVKPVAERQWVFKVAQSNEHTSPWQVKYAQAKGYTKIANLYVNNAYGEDGAAAIRATAEAAGIEIVLEDTFNADDTDMTAQITKIKASDAQAVLVTAIPPAAAIFTKQYRELGVELPLLHNSGIGMQSFIDLAGATNAEGVIFPMGKIVAADSLADDDPQKAVLQQFIADFEAYASKAPSQFAAHSCDAIQLVLRALEALPDGLALSDVRAKVRDGIETTTGYVGLDGIFNFSAEDHVGLSTSDVVLVRITDGKWAYFPQDQW